MRMSIFISIFLFLGSFVFAQEIQESVTKKIIMEVQKEIDGRLRDVVTPLIIAEKLKMPFPPVAPTRTIADIKKEVSQKVTELVNEKFPLSEKDKKMALARKKYFLYKKGDNIPSLQVRAAGRGSVVQGQFKGLNRKGELLIGGAIIPKVDMTENVMVHFDPVLNKQKIDKYVKNKLFYFYEDREKMAKDITPALEKTLFGEAGYFMEGDKFLPANEFLKSQYISKKAAASKEIKDVVEKEIYGKYGYAKNDDVWHKTELNETALETDKESTGKGDDLFDQPEDKVADESVDDKPAAEVEKKAKKSLFDPKFYDPDF